MEIITRENIMALNSKINEARSNEKFCDVTIKIGEKAFKCHRLILSSASAYFDGMFNGSFKESNSEVIVLKEIEVGTFEDVLQFMYSSEVAVAESNVLNLIRASEFFNVPGLRKFCYKFIEEKMEANVIIEDALEILAFCRGTLEKDRVFSVRLSRYIKKNLHYFLSSPSFLNIEFDDLKAILAEPSLMKNENVSFHAIIRWIQQSIHSKEVEGELLNALLDTVNFENISPEYVRYITTRCLVKERNAAKQNDKSNVKDDKKEDVSSAELLANSEIAKISDLIPQSLYVYVKDVQNNVTNVFSLHKCSMGFNWMPLGQANDNSDSMRVVSLNGRLYCLNYRKKLLKPIQTFNVSSSVSLFAKSSLKPPPLVVNRFDMCGMNNYLYMYNKDNFSNVVQSVQDLDFNDEMISRGVYAYNCEIDRWISLPPLLQKLANACMTCEDKGGLIFLIGGKNPTQERLHGYAQAYDPRCGAWMAIPPSDGSYENGACCCTTYIPESTFTVTGNISEPKVVEQYNKVAGEWLEFDDEMNSQTNNHRLICHHKNVWAFGKNLTESSVEFNGSDSDWEWLNIPSLSEAANGCKSCVEMKSSVNHVVVDCVTFKPFGL